MTRCVHSFAAAAMVAAAAIAACSSSNDDGTRAPYQLVIIEDNYVSTYTKQ